MKIILDNGHGNNTPGKRSPKWTNGEQLFEWEFNRGLVKRVADHLTFERYDFEILVPEKKDIPIRERVERANEIHRAEKSILISLHGNAAPNDDTRPHGIETFHYSEAGKVLAKAVHEELINTLDWKDRGIRKAYQRIKNKKGKRVTIYKIAILKFTDMLAILTENGFYTNFDECIKMLDPDVCEDIAIATVNGLKQYIINQNS